MAVGFQAFHREAAEAVVTLFQLLAGVAAGEGSDLQEEVVVAANRLVGAAKTSPLVEEEDYQKGAEVEADLSSAVVAVAKTSVH